MGYWRRGLINYRVALRLLVPSIIGAVLSSVALIYIINEVVLKFAYSVFMLMVSMYMFARSSNIEFLQQFFNKGDDNNGEHERVGDSSSHSVSGTLADDLLGATAVVQSPMTQSPMVQHLGDVEGGNNHQVEVELSASHSFHPSTHEDNNNSSISDTTAQQQQRHIHEFGELPPANLSPRESLLLQQEIQRHRLLIELHPIDYFGSFCGGILTGMLGVGTGEMTMLVLLHRNYVFPVAAASSVLVVASTCFVTAIIQVATLSSANGPTAIPWGVVIYAIPGVVVGAQIATAMQGKIPKLVVMRCVGILFAIIGVAFMYLTVHHI